MNTTDITERQFETLTLLRLLKEFIKETEDFDTLSDAVVALMEGQSIDREKFIEDICALTENGYVHSDTNEIDTQTYIPDVDDITMKGVEILNNFVTKTLEEQPADTSKASNTKNFSLAKDVSFNFSILGGIELGASLIKDVDSIFKQLAAKLKELFSLN